MSNLGLGVAAILAGVLIIVAGIGLYGAGQVRAKVSAEGKRILRMRRQWLRNPFTPGLTPLAMVYRVSTARAESDGKVSVRLYAFDPGHGFSRTSTVVQQFTGGVWRNA